MGMMLRRYHEPLTKAAARKSAAAKAVAEKTPEQLEAARVKAEKKAADKAEKKAAKKALKNVELAKVEPEADASEAEQFAIVETADGKTIGDGESLATLEPSDKHGDLDMPNRGSSKQNWLDYTAADPAGSPEGYEELTRDALAELYMGPRAE
jgi:membrane protein involved in colicin uptake